MKTKLLSIFACCSLFLCVLSVSAQEKTYTNRYSMKLELKPDGTYALQKEKRYAKIVDLASIPDLYVPYEHVNNKLTSKDYRLTETMEYTYKTHDGYELKMAVDFAKAERPTPVMVYVHGGGWARGSMSASRSLSKYLAQQKGITGVRIEYTLAPQPGANVQVSIQDVMDAVQYLRDHAVELNINPSRIGFLGTSAGAHLAAVAAMKTHDAKVFVGYSGIYNLTTASITVKSKDSERINYFGGLNQNYLADASPALLIPKKKNIAALLVCGTADITVEYSQSQEFANALKRQKSKPVELLIYKNYDHNLNSKKSDKMEEIFFKTADFVSANL